MLSARQVREDVAGGTEMKKNTVIAAVVVLIALGAAWYWGSPRWTLHEMKAAAEAGDTDKLASYIDFPALRTSMKEEIKAQAVAEFTKPGNDGMAALGAAFATTMVDGMIDGLITPSTMRKVFVANKEGGPKGITKVDASRKDLVIDRNGLDQFRVHAPTGKEAAGGLVFSRYGLGWKLSGMRFAD